MRGASRRRLGHVRDAGVQRHEEIARADEPGVGLDAGDRAGCVRTRRALERAERERRHLVPCDRYHGLADPADTRLTR